MPIKSGSKSALRCGICLLAILFLFLSSTLSAKPKVSPLTPQPTSCIVSTFSAQGNAYYKNIALILTNQCGASVDLQNSTITFQSTNSVNTSFWSNTNFSPLSYPVNGLQITSQGTSGAYSATFMLQFPTASWATSVLPANASIQINYGVANDGHIGSANVYLNNTATPTGSIQLTNTSTRPSDVSQAYVQLNILSNGANVTTAQVPWNGAQLVSGLAAGSYNITASNVSGSSATYQSSVIPSSVVVVANQTAMSTVSYARIAPTGQLAIQLQALPSALAGYTANPVAQVIQSFTNSTVAANVMWSVTTMVSSLNNGSTYSFSAPAISYNGNVCQPTFTPANLTASATSVPVTSLTYACTLAAQSPVTLSVTGAPSTLTSLKVTLTPNNTTQPISENIPLINGRGSRNITLNTGSVYNVTAEAVVGYVAKFSPQPFTATAGATETISLTAEQQGTPVSLNGQLSVCGTHLCNQQGQPIQLKGMSTHGIQWYGWQGSNTQTACLTKASLDTLAYDWKASVMRISMYVQEGGYASDPAGFTNQVNALIDQATSRGMYAIVDWHILNPGDPNVNLSLAKTFFTAIASTHKNYNNLLYEIANEPNGVSWSSIRTYANALIPTIRAIDPKTVILVGTEAWSSLGVSSGTTYQSIVDAPVIDPSNNVMYTFHFYAASHGQNYLSAVDAASNVLPIFVTEFGEQTYSGDGANDFFMTDQYLQLFARKQISWVNWNYSDDGQSGAIWKSGVCPNGPWSDANLKPSGTYIKAAILK